MKRKAYHEGCWDLDANHKHFQQMSQLLLDIIVTVYGHLLTACGIFVALMQERCLFSARK